MGTSMFAFKPRMEITIRIFLMAVMLFNALVPTATVAQAKQESTTGQAVRPVHQQNRSIPTFERPEPRINALPQSAASTVPGSPQATVQLSGSYSSASATTAVIQEPVLMSLDDTDAAIIYSGDWTHNQQTGEYNSTISYALTAGSYASYTFVGATVTLYSRPGPSRGFMAVYVDGNFQTSIDLYSSSPIANKVVYSASFPFGQHTIRIEATGEKNPSSSGIVINLSRILYADQAIVDDPEFDYSGNWSHPVQGGEYLSTMSTTSTAGASATYTFTGSTMVLYSRPGPTRGFMAVYLDGELKANVDLYRSSVVANVVVYSTSLPWGQHTVRVEATGQKNPSSSGTTIILSRMDYVSAREIDDPAFTYAGEWSNGGGWTGVYNGTTSTADTPGAYATYTFTGSVIALYGKTWNDRGIMAVYLDGSLLDTVDLYTPSYVWQNLVYSTAFPYGRHTIKLKWTGTKNPDSEGTSIIFDRMIYLGEGPTGDLFPGSMMNGGENKSSYSTGTESDCPFAALKPAGGICGDPINTKSGAFSLAQADLSLPTPGGDLIFQRSYSSATVTKYTSPLGYGWTHNHDAQLIFPTDPGGMADYVLFQSVLGNQFQFHIESDGSFTPGPGVLASLVQVGDTYTLVTSQRSIFAFNSGGQITSRQDAQGHSFQYDYDTNGRLTQVSAVGGGQFIQIHYDAQGRIDYVKDHTDRQVDYHYETDGDLASVTDVLGQTWTFNYDANHRMTRMLDPNSQQTVKTDYDSQGRAYRQYDGAGKLLVRIVYNSDGSATIYDVLSHFREQRYNSHDVNTGEVDALGHSTVKTFDNNFRPITIDDANGATTLLRWSANGANLEYVKDPLNHETFISYNASNQPTSITDPLHYETRYYYNDAHFPTLPTRVEYPLSFDNGVTYVGTNYEYYPPSSGASAGKVKFVSPDSQPPTYYTYTSSGQIESVTVADGTTQEQTTTYTYDDLGRLVDLTDDQGVVTHNEYDDAGRLLKTTRNYDVSRPQNDENKYNLVTEYRYDKRGNQIAVIDTYGVITRTYYDLVDRPVIVVQNLTGRTIETVTAPERGSGAADENIRTDTIYDDAGNAIATIDPAGIITRTYYDEANRPRITVQNLVGQDISIITPPPYNAAFPDQNIHTEMEYDANGNVIASTDTHGVITRMYYDAANRPVTVVQNLTGQAISVETPPGRGTSSNIRTDTYYDANGNVIATVDPRGVITRTYYDALNRPITVVQNLSGQAIGSANPPRAGIEVNIRTDTYYDPAGNVIATVDPRGVVTRTYYDEANRPVTTVRNLVGQDIYVDTPPARGSAGENVRTDVAYDEHGRRDTTTDPAERVTRYEYNELGQLFKATVNYANGGVPQNHENQRNIVTQYAYDALGRQMETTDTSGRVTRNVYDDLGRLTSTTQNYWQGHDQNYKDASKDRYNLVTSYTYDLRGNQIAVTDTAGVVTRTYYDGLSRPITVVRNLVGQSITASTPPERANPPSSVNNLRTDTVYLGTGSVDYVVDEMGVASHFSYDSLGRLTTSSDALSHPTQFEYDANGNRTSMTDAETVVTRYEYDPLNRLSAVIENYTNLLPPDEETNVRTEYTYDAAGNRLSILDGRHHTTSFTYTRLGQLESETDALDHTTNYGYDAMGNRALLVDANGKQISFTYDELNRLITIDYPSPDVDVTFAYDALGNRTGMGDGLGSTSWEYTNLGLPKLITDPFGTGVSYDYDALGNRTDLSYDDQAYSYEYNDVNRLVSVNSNQSAVAGYQYDAAGRIKSIARANDVDTLYNYYENGWLQEITHSSGGTTLASYQYQYDNVGNRTQATENVLFPTLPLTATPTLPTTPTETLVSTPTETVTATPSPTETMSPTSTDTATPTDTPLTPQGRVPSGNFVLAYSAASQPRAIAPRVPVYQEEPTATPTDTPAPTQTETATLTPTDTPTSTETLIPTVTDTPSITPTLTATPAPIPLGPVTINYDYDPLYRLTAADYSTGDYYYYTYDAVGNRMSQNKMVSGLSSTVAYTYDNANRLDTVNGVTYTWDDNGNLLNDGTNTYTYDSANRLKTMTGPSVNASYGYNGMGDRLQETAGEQTTTFTMDLNTGLTQALSDGTNMYIYGNGRIAQVNTSTEYFLGDALGSVRQLTDESGVVTYASAYDPYGVETQSYGSSQTTYGYTGEYTSNDMVYLRARHYAPGIGRFLTRDIWSGNANLPISYNKWAYVGGNPVNLTDPSGNAPPLWCQSMANKALYEACVDLFYGIEPENYFTIGENIRGEKGCYVGPTKYRAPGYVEGTGATPVVPWAVNWLFTGESVYDFATMQRKDFINGGIGASDFILGLMVTEYAGLVFGFNSDGDIYSDYSGTFITSYIGVSVGLIDGSDLFGPSVGVGMTNFWSPFDPMIRGKSVYVSVGLGVDILPVRDIGFGITYAFWFNRRAQQYNKNQKAKLFLDILLGNHSGWATDLAPHERLNASSMSRAVAAGMSLRYWMAYEELPHGNR